MYKPQSALTNLIKNRNHPFKVQRGGCSWGKVVAQNADGTVNVAMQNGATYQHVPVEAPVSGSQVGQFYNPTNDLTNPITDPGGIWDTPIASGKRDLFCEVGFLEGSTRQPVVRGFLPSTSSMSVMPVGVKVDLHEGGAYHVTTPPTTGQPAVDQFVWPDGSYLSVGSTSQVNMATLNPNWAPNTQATPAPVVFHHASGVVIEISPTGAVSISGSTSVGTGAQHPVAFADTLQSWINNHSHTNGNNGGNTGSPVSPISGITAANLTTS